MKMPTIIKFMSAFLLCGLNIGCHKEPHLAGFKLGQEIEVNNSDVRAELSLTKPRNKELKEIGYKYIECKTEYSDSDFDQVYLDFSERNKIIAIRCEKKFKTLADAVLYADASFNRFVEEHGADVIEMPPPEGVRRKGIFGKDAHAYIFSGINQREFRVILVYADAAFVKLQDLEFEKEKEAIHNAQRFAKQKAQKDKELGDYKKRVGAIADILDAVQSIRDDFVYYYYAWEMEEYAGYSQIKRKLRRAFDEVEYDDTEVKRLKKKFTDLLADLEDDAIVSRKKSNAFRKQISSDMEDGKLTNITAKPKWDEYAERMRQKANDAFSEIDTLIGEIESNYEIGD